MPRPPETIILTWRNITCNVQHVRDWKIDGWLRLIVRVVSPRGAPLPFAEASDYHVHHVRELDEDDLKAAGGPAAFLLALMDEEATSLRYGQALYRWKQGDLFEQRMTEHAR
jgi:hypothetical protein